MYKLLSYLDNCDKDEMVDKNRGNVCVPFGSMQILTKWTRRDSNMINRVYERVCKKRGHNWAYQDNETFITKICLNCFMEQFFFAEETDQEVIE